MRSRGQTVHKYFLFIVALALPLFFSLPLAHAEPWAEHVQRLPSEEHAIEVLQGEINELIEQKRHTEDQAALKKIIDEMASKHKELVRLIEEHNTQLLHVRFKHPEKADVVALKFKHFEPKTLEQMENDFGLDGRLDRIKARVTETFPAPIQVKEKAEPLKVSPLLRLPASEKYRSEDEDAPERIKLVK
jgi:hypothetical protein